MKKSLTVIIALLFAMLFIKVDANAQLDISTNLINDEEFDYYTNSPGGLTNAYIELRQKGTICLEINKEYFILPTYVNKRDFGDLDITWSDLPLLSKDKVLSTIDDDNNQTVLTNTKELVSNGVFCGYAFIIKSGSTNFSYGIDLLEGKIDAEIFDDYFNTNIGQISKSLLLIKADDIKNIPGVTGYRYKYNANVSSYDISALYFGENYEIFKYGLKHPELDLPDDDPVFNPHDSTYTTSVSNPTSIENMMSEIELTAYDDIDGDITNRIIVESDAGYFNLLNESNIKNRILGLYPVRFSVSDESNNIAYCNININVIDTDDPTLISDSILSYTRDINDSKITIEEIISNIYIDDNHSDITHSIIRDTYIGNEKKIGTFEYLIRFSDRSDNYIEVIVVIINKDFEAPVFTYSDTKYDISYLDNENLNNILSKLDIKVNDNYSFIHYEVISDDYTNNIGKVGRYYVKLEANDSSNNRSELVITINIIDDKAPTFYANKIFIETNAKRLLSIGDIKTKIIESGDIKSSSFKMEVLSDTYSDNYLDSGEYEMKVKLTYENGEEELRKIGINVSEIINKTTFISKVWSEIKKISLYIWNIIKWPFEKLFSFFS